MKIISIGSACQVKCQINKHHQKEETQFFDWFIIDFKTVLHVLKNIHNHVISKTKFTDASVFIEGQSWIPDYHKIEHTDCKMVSVHDFPSNIPYNNYMPEFLQKYKRRLKRLKSCIKDKSQNIHMIHCIDHQFTEGYIPTQQDIHDFFQIINIKKNNVFLHIVIPPKYNIDTSNLKINDRVFIYYLQDNHSVPSSWENYNFNWKIVFDNITRIG
jgi:hypothetical protein